jgi:hypothetical protein
MWAFNVFLLPPRDNSGKPSGLACKAVSQKNKYSRGSSCGDAIQIISGFSKMLDLTPIVVFEWALDSLRLSRVQFKVVNVENS